MTDETYYNQLANIALLIENATPPMGTELPRWFCKVPDPGQCHDTSVSQCQYLLHHRQAGPLEFWDLRGLWGRACSDPSLQGAYHTVR